jgi:hypothetical protein
MKHAGQSRSTRNGESSFAPLCGEPFVLDPRD